MSDITSVRQALATKATELAGVTIAPYWIGRGSGIRGGALIDGRDYFIADEDSAMFCPGVTGEYEIGVQIWAPRTTEQIAQSVEWLETTREALKVGLFNEDLNGLIDGTAVIRTTGAMAAVDDTSVVLSEVYLAPFKLTEAD